jgi:hypothetical protein
MPWSPTQQFPHPLANIQSSNTEVNIANFVSYALVEMMTWQGLGGSSGTRSDQFDLGSWNAKSSPCAIYLLLVSFAPPPYLYQC